MKCSFYTIELAHWHGPWIRVQWDTAGSEVVNSASVAEQHQKLKLISLFNIFLRCWSESLLKSTPLKHSNIQSSNIFFPELLKFGCQHDNSTVNTLCNVASTTFSSSHQSVNIGLFVTKHCKHGP